MKNCINCKHFIVKIMLNGFDGACNKKSEYVKFMNKCNDWEEKTKSYNSNELFSEIEKFTRLQRENKEKTLAEIITKYDFVVGSKECKCKLMEVLPEGANIICSPYIESPTTIYAIKKFDAMDLSFDRPEKGDKE